MKTKKRSLFLLLALALVLLAGAAGAGYAYWSKGHKFSQGDPITGVEVVIGNGEEIELAVTLTKGNVTPVNTVVDFDEGSITRTLSSDAFVELVPAEVAMKTDGTLNDSMFYSVAVPIKVTISNYNHPDLDSFIHALFATFSLDVDASVQHLFELGLYVIEEGNLIPLTENTIESQSYYEVEGGELQAYLLIEFKSEPKNQTEYNLLAGKTLEVNINLTVGDIPTP